MGVAIMKKLLVIVDMVNGFVKEGALAAPSIMRIVPRQIHLLDEALVNDDMGIVFIRDNHNEDAIEFKTYGPHCINDTFETELISELKKYELEYLHRVEETNKLRNIVADYLSHLVQFNIDITMNFKTYSTVDLIQEIIKFNTQIIKFHYQIELFLDSPSTDSHSKIENALKRVLNSVWEIRDSVENKEKFNMSLAIYSLSLQAVREELSNLIIQEIKKQKGE